MNTDEQTYQPRDEVAELAMLYEISQTLNRTVDLRQHIDPVLEAIANYINATHCVLTLREVDSGESEIVASFGLSSTQQRKGKYTAGEGITGRVAESGRPIAVPKVHEDRGFIDRTGISRTFGRRDTSFICVPVIDNDETLGTLSADHPFDPKCDLQEDIRLLSIVASLVSQSLRVRQMLVAERKQLEAERQRLEDENKRLQSKLRDRFNPTNFIGTSQAMAAIYDDIMQVAPATSTVLIRGESGTGKELAANAIHHNSKRADGPYVRVNCAALPESVLEAELFGYVAGAFTGAVGTREGRFATADGGTLFLDEIGDFSPVAQVKLLRVLQEKEFEPVGSSETRKVDVRVVAATNRNLEEMVERGEFRQDLYYRLNVFFLTMPPLRNRKSDILLLADHFVEKYAAENEKEVRRISSNAINMLTAYHWPGNVRELENCIERATLLSTDGVIHGRHLPPTLQMPRDAHAINDEDGLPAAVESLERKLIVESLKMHNGNCAKAAEDLKITPRIMSLRLNKLGIDWRIYRS